MGEDRRYRVHWAWLPAAMVYSIAAWIRWGPLLAMLLLAAGLGAGMVVERRARRRRRRSWARGE